MYEKMTKLACFTVVALLAISTVNCDVDLDRLLHNGIPASATAVPAVQPTSVNTIDQQPAAQQGNIPAQNSDVFDKFEREVFSPYRNTRHDEFDWALSKNVLSKETQNTILSSFLVKLLLSILGEAAGEGTSTHRELQSVLPSIESTAETRILYGKAFGSMLQENPNYKLNLGARLYVDKFIPPGQRFQAIIKTFYHSDVESVDFGKPAETAAIINAWCANATKNHITNIVSGDDIAHSVILLLNTIYFNGHWRRPFPENQTVPMDFNRGQNDISKVPFMVDTADYHYFESVELDSKILRLPYKGDKFAMYIVLPQKVDGINQLVAKIDSSSFRRAQLLLEEVEVKVALPKFQFSNSIRLNDVLKDLGIRQMFTNQASFPLMARGAAVQDRLQVSNVLQKTGIEVNEQGSTAFAATQISLTNKFGGDFEFIANHPFLFLIEDETTGTMIFTGKVQQPGY